MIFISFLLMFKWDFSQTNKVRHTQRLFLPHLNTPPYQNSISLSDGSLALDGRMKYSITLFSCANEAECGFRGFLFSKVACLVMHMPPSYVSFRVPAYSGAVP